MSLALVLAAAASACSVCFSDDGSGMVLGLQWGIVVLLASVSAMLAGLAYAVYRIEKGRHDDIGEAA